MYRIAALVLGALLLGTLALPALAQDVPADAQVTIYDTWDDDLVEGDDVRPMGSLVTAGIKKKKPSTLIKIRQHFVFEMLKNVEKL
jgi:hypothetical protein